MIEYKSVSLANQVFERIEYNILSGEYAIGEIISEKRFAAELGVSRTPIREALSRLLEERLVADSPNGTVVLGITDKDVDDAYEVKRRIEVLATRWASQLIDGEGIRRLSDIIDQQEFYAQKNDTVKVRDLDTDFHDTIYEYCGSTVLQGILSPLHHKIMKFRNASLQSNEKRVPESIAEHRAILDALAEHEDTKVETLMLVHVEHAYKGVVRERESRKNRKTAENENAAKKEEA